MGFEQVLRRLALSPGGGWLRAIGVALLCVAVCSALRLAAVPLLGSLAGSVLFVPGVLIASLWAGRRSGLIAIVFAAGAAYVFASMHPDPLVVRTFIVSIGSFVLVGGFAVEVAASLRRALKAEAEAVRGLESGQTNLRLAHEAGRLGAWEWDLATDRLRLSDGYMRNWRVLEQNEVPFLELAARVHPEDQAGVLEARRRVLEDGAPYVSEYRVVGKDGEVRWYTSQGEAQRDASGKVVRVHGVNRDITEEKRREIELRESEARFRAMANSAPSPVWVTRAEGGVEFVNEAFVEFFGQDRDELLGDRWMELMHPDDRDAVVQLYREKRVLHQPYGWHARFRNAQGEYRWVSARCSPRSGPDGGFMGYVGIAFDITADRQASAALRESEARFRIVADSAPVNLWMSDEKGACAYLNRAQRDFWGLGEDYLDTFDWGATVHPDDAEALWAVQGRAMERQEPFEAEARFRRADGEWRILHTTAQPRIDAEGNFVGMIGVNVDVTDIRMAEQALRESEARFRAMADSAPSPIWVSGPEGGIDFINQAGLEFFGAPENILGMAWVDRLHPDERPRVMVVRNAAFERREGFTFEARFLNGQDQYRWMRCTTRTRFGADGEFLGFLGIAFDVTDAREAQENLKMQERRQRFLLQLGDGLRETDEPRSIAAFAERSIGAHLHVARAGYGEIDEDEACITIKDSWTAGDLDPITGKFSLESYGAGVIPELRKGRTVRVVDTATDPRTADGSDVFHGEGVRARLSVPVVRGGKTRAIFFLHDIKPREWTSEEVALAEEAATRTWTEIERARALADVRESEERFRSIANSAPILVWVTNADRVRAFVNQTYVEFVGGTYEEARVLDWRQVLHPDDHARILKEQIAGETSLKPFSLEARYRRYDGTYRWLRSYSRPRFAADGELLGFVGAAYDVTEERQVQADLQHINELLAERVALALAQKEQAEAALLRAQKLEALGRLTGGVAHDFNNLLTVVVGALDMILKHPDDAAKRERMAQAAMAAARRGEQLTHQLLAFSRRQALRPALSDVNALIRECEPLIRRAVGENVDFACELASGQAVVRVDPAQFEAALFNLVVNARDATPEGGRIAVTTSWRDLGPEDGIEAPPGRHVCVSVTDTGAGMDPEVLARVFEPFFTTKPQGKGTGLGLSQVYGFTQQSGGGVHVDSTPGAGTTVSLFLPASTEVLPAEAKAPAAPEEAQGPLKVLLVEDDAEVGAIAETMLRHLGHEVTRVTSAARALAKLRAKTPYDLLLTDVVMPGRVDGVELAQRAVEMRPSLHVVLTSGYAGEAVDRTLANAPWPFLRKPYSQQELADILRSAVPPAKPRARKPATVEA